MKKIFPIASVERLAKKAGAERISKEAILALSELLEDYAKRVAEGAVKYARYARRSTIKREDIDLSASE